MFPSLQELSKYDIVDRARIFATWLRTKPPGEQFVFMDLGNCALAQFGVEIVNDPDIKVTAGALSIRIWPPGEQNYTIRIVPSLRAQRAIMSDSRTFGETSILFDEAIDKFNSGHPLDTFFDETLKLQRSS